MTLFFWIQRASERPVGRNLSPQYTTKPNRSKNYTVLTMSVTSLPSQMSTSARDILCYYINSTSILQMVRLNGARDRDFERIVFPGQRLLFEAPPESLFEISANGQSLDRIPCDRLQVDRLN